MLDPIVVIDRLREKSIEVPNRQFETPCWVWTGANNGAGYGKPSMGGRKVLTHRVAYEALRAEIPPGLSIDHLCGVKMCWNPWHLEPVTHKVNILRSTAPTAENSRKTHCPRGHSYSGENLYVKPSGYRECRTCNRMRPRK